MEGLCIQGAPEPSYVAPPTYAWSMFSAIHRLALRIFGLLPRWARRRLVRLGSPKYTVGAMCVVERSDGRVLMVRQTYRNRWGLPGGLVKRREPAGVAARRETLEETGLVIELVGQPAVVAEPRLQRIDVVFKARPADGVDPDTAAPRSAEITECRWVDPTNLPELQSETASALVALARRTGDTLTYVTVH